MVFSFQWRSHMEVSNLIQQPLSKTGLLRRSRWFSGRLVSTPRHLDVHHQYWGQNEPENVVHRGQFHNPNSAGRHL